MNFLLKLKKWHKYRKRKNNLRKNYVNFQKKKYNFGIKKINLNIFLRFKKILLLLFLTTFFTAIFFSPLFRINEIIINRQNLVVDTLEAEIFLNDILYKKNILLVSKKNISNLLKQEFPQWKSFIIEKKFPNKILVQIETYQIFAYVRIMDENNKIKSELPINELGNISYLDFDVDPSLYINYLEPLEQIPMFGDSLIFAQDIKKIKQIKNILLENYELLTKNIDYFKFGKEVHFNVFKYFLWFDLSQDLTSQLKRYDYVLTELNQKDLEYIDLRIKNRVIYKENEKK